MKKWRRCCSRCFYDLEDTDVRCSHCGYDYVKLHIRITAIHKKAGQNYKDRKLWLGKTGEFIIETDYQYENNSPIEAGWYGGYFIPDESPSETWLHHAIQFIEVQQPALASEEETKSAAKSKAANKKMFIVQPRESDGVSKKPSRPMINSGRKLRGVFFLIIAAVCLVISALMPESNTLGTKLAVIVVTIIRTLAGGCLLIFLIGGIYYLITGFANSRPFTGKAPSDGVDVKPAQNDLPVQAGPSTDAKPDKHSETLVSLAENKKPSASASPEPSIPPVSGPGQKLSRKAIIGAIVGGILLVTIIGLGIWLVNSNSGVRAFLSLYTPTPTAIGGGTGRIAFSAENNGNRDIYVMDMNGSNVTRLTNNEAWDWSPVWSPDGKQIAFLSWRDGNMQIYIMYADGSSERCLTNTQSNEGYPAWSPDGKSIAFVSGRDEPDWAGCGTSATGCNSNIYLINIESFNETRLTDNPLTDEGPSWSPDGEKIVFHSNRDGNMEIYVMEANGSNVTRLTNDKAYDWRPAWSPDEKHIIFMSFIDGINQIYEINADGSNVTRLTNDQTDDSAPDWSPDGQHIAFHSSSSDGNTRICIMDFDGSNMTCLTNGPINALEPKWQPFTTLANNLAITATKPTSGGDLFPRR